MADIADAGQTQVTFPRTVQYQEVAAPPPAVETAAPVFFAAYAPSWFPPRYPQHTGATAPPPFETLPSPDFGPNAFYPSRLDRARALAVYPQPVMNLDPIPFPVPDFGQRAIFPDRLDRQRGLWPMPFTSERNLEPSAGAIAPDFGNRAFFPDRLERIRALGEYPQPVINFEPIPGATVPDFIETIFPERMPRHPPPFQPSFHYTPTPTNFLTLDDSSRGLYQGIRGLYENLESAHCEPFAGFTTENAQSIPDSAYTLADVVGITSDGGFTTANMDPWGLVDLVNDRIIFKHDGYYVVSVDGAWANNSTGERRARVRLFDANAVVNRVLMEDIRPASFTSTIAAASRVQSIGAGRYIQLDLYQSSGGPLTGGPFHVSIVRVARPRTVLPI